MAQYIIKKGDNLSTVAKKNGVKLKDLLSINKINNPDYIQAGQKINLPDNKPNFKGTNYTQFSDDYNATPKWDKITPNAGNSKTIKSTPSKQVLKSKSIPVKQNDEPGFLDSMKNKIYETYQDVTTAIDQQTSKKVVAKPKVKIDDSFINYGYKELGTYKDESFKAGKKDSLLSAMNVFDNDKGFDYIVSPKIKEGKKTFNNVKGVAHFLMDSDITPNQKYTSPYIEKGNNTVKSAQAGKFTPYLGTNPDDYVMYYKNTGNDKMNVKYGQLKDKDKYKGYEQIKVRSIPFGELDFNNKKSAGFAKKASYIGTLDGKQTSIITDPESNDVYGRFSGGSGIFHFKEPKTGKTISVDVSGSVNTIKQVGEELSKKYGVDKKQLQFLYHDMGSYSAKPKSHNGVLSNEQWENYNSNNKGYSGAALMYPMEYGGNVIQPSQSESTQLIKNQKYIVDDANNYRLNLLEQTSEDFMKGWVTSPMYKKMFDKSKQKGEEPIPESWITNTKWGRKPILTKEGVAGNYNSRTDSLYIKNNILTSKNQAYATGVHEISHSSDNGGDIIPLNDVKKMKDYAKIDREKYYGELPWYKKILYDKTELNNSVKEDLDFKKYVAEPTETRARLNVIRALGKKQGVYDPYISPINSQQLNEIKFEDDGYNPIDQLKLIYSDEEIIDMLNSISKNNDKKIIRGKFGTTAETIYSMNEQPKVILTPDDIKAESGFNIGDISNEGYINNAYDKQMPIIPSLEQLNTLNKFKGVVNKYGEEEAFNKGYYEQPDIALTKGLEDYYYKYGRKKGNFSGNEVLNYLNSKPYLPQPQIKKGSYIEQFKEGGYAKDGFNYQDYMPMERDIPVDTTTSYNRDIDRFAWRNTLQNLPDIQKQQQLPNQQIDSSYYTTKTPRGYFNVYDKQNQLVGYSMDNKTVIKQEPNFEDGGNINTLEGDLFSKILMFRNQDKQFVDRQLHPEKYLDKIIQNPDGTHSTHKMAWGEDEKGQAYMFPTLFNDKNESIKVPNQYADYISSKGYKNPIFKENGGIVKAWIQKFSKGGYIADGGFPGGQELTQPTTNYYNWGNYGNQNSFLTPEQINQKPFQNTVPLANTNMSQNIGTNYFTPYDASNDQVNKDNQLASSMMKSSSKGLSDPVSMGLDIGGKSLDATANLLGSLGKDNSKAQAFGQGASGAMNVASQVTAPFKDIPIAGKAIDAVGKTLGFFIGGALNARKQGIKNEEMDKYNKLQEYTSRNTQTAQQPSYYGQYMSKYGANPKMMEQRVMDDIYSDFDKYLKLT